MTEEKVNNILEKLNKSYPDAKCALNFKSPYELLISTILSAQCTDKRVNVVTEKLYQEYNTPKKMIELTQEKLQDKIKSCGLYKNKSKNILETSKILLEKYNGEVPKTREELTKLSGVGRKTANVVMSNAFNIPAIAVDTHVFRVSNRIGLTNAKNVLDTEKQLMKNIPKEEWSKTHHLLIFHGRNICTSRKPKCEECPIKEYCDYNKKY